MRSLILVAVGLAMTSALTAQPLEPGRHPMTFTASADGTEQPYYLFVPTAHSAETPCPLIVVLHGKTATWQSWFDATSVCEWAEREGFLVAAPHGRGDWFYLGLGESDALDVIEEVKRLCSVDEDRVHLMGHSMGGWGTWHLGTSHPDLFATIVPMSGWAPLDRLENLTHTAVFVAHGDADEIVPVEWSHEAVARLGELGIDHRYVEAPGVGHESSLISDLLPEIGDWLRDRRRASRPHTLSLRAQTARRGRSHWLAIRETRRYPDLAGIDGRISENHIALQTFNVASFALDPAAAPLDPEGEILLEVNSLPLTAPSVGDGEVLLLRAQGQGWTLEAIPAESAAPPPPREIALPLDPEAGELCEQVAHLLNSAFDVDATLLHRELVAPSRPAGEWTTDSLLDIYLRPMDTLCIVTISAGQITSPEAVAEWSPWWWGEAVIATPLPSGDPERMVRLLCTDRVAQRMERDAEPVGRSITETLAQMGENR
jgi:dienelactone hydrolase